MASLSTEELKKMKVAELKTELKNRGLAATGTKDVLLERLQESIDGKVLGTTADNSVGMADSSLEESIDELMGEPKLDAAVAPVAKSKENIPTAEQLSDSEGKKTVSLKGLSEAERALARAQKFGGSVSDAAKKAKRAERFGLPDPDSGKAPATETAKIAAAPATGEDLEKLKKRADRFGQVVANKLSKADDDEKKRKRMERFGTVTAPSSEPKKVKLSSVTSDTEERKKKRAERFGLT